MRGKGRIAGVLAGLFFPPTFGGTSNDARVISRYGIVRLFWEITKAQLVCSYMLFQGLIGWLAVYGLDSDSLGKARYNPDSF